MNHSLVADDRSEILLDDCAKFLAAVSNVNSIASTGKTNTYCNELEIRLQFSSYRIRLYRASLCYCAKLKAHSTCVSLKHLR
eukprot:scaffold59070_cov28-Tisochrysis_lutea.AAC.1